MTREWTPLYAAICTSEKLSKLPDDEARLFYVLMVTQWDAWGRCTGRPHVLLARVWPLLGKTVAAVERCLAACGAVGLIETHERDGVCWVELPDWEEKAGKHVKEGKRGKPDFPRGDANSRRTLESSGVAQPAPSERKKEREKETLEEEAAASPAAASPAAASPAAAAPKAKKPRTVPEGDHPQLMDHWWQEWQRTRGTPYAFQTKHGQAAKKILALHGSTLQEACRRVTRLLEHSDPWMAENASLCLVESRWNELGVSPAAKQGESAARRAAREELRQPLRTANGRP